MFSKVLVLLSGNERLHRLERVMNTQVNSKTYKKTLR